MGEPAIWLSSANIEDGEGLISPVETKGDVLFKDPSEPLQIGDSDGYEYRICSATAEYYDGTFAGLKEAVDAGKTEYLIVREKVYLVSSVITKFDGKMYVAHLDPHKS